jgi:hypothetical protein
MRSERGVALILAILVTSFLFAIGMGLALVVMMDQLASGNLRSSVAMLHAADAALELAVRDLARLEDWNTALTGAARSDFADGEPSGVRAIPNGGTVDLTVATNYLNCGRATDCTAPQMLANTRERPWGENNAEWRLYAYGPVGNIVQFARPSPCYLAVWIADDGRESDGDPQRDAEADLPGHGVIRARAEAFGPLGARRAIQAEVARLCVDEEDPCRRGIRVQSWQEVRQMLP